MTPSLRTLRAGPRWRDVPRLPGFEEPVPNIDSQWLGLPGTMQDGSAPFGDCYRTLFDDGELRVAAQMHLTLSLEALCPDVLYSGPIFTSTEHLGPKPGERDLAREWINRQYGLIQRLRPNATVYQYDLPGVDEPVKWPDHCRVRDLYPTQASVALECRANVQRYAEMVPLVTDWMNGNPSNPRLDDARYAAMMQTALLMAKHSGEVWLWGEAWTDEGVKRVVEGQERLREWVLGIPAATPAPEVA